jgi:Uma2 family endonuclease
LANYVEPRGLGWVNGEGTSYRCFPDDENRVRRADVTFHRLDRLTPEQAAAEGHIPVVPDLVVEVNEKRTEWLEAGAQLVWVIDPVRQEIQAYHADGTVAHFGRTDTLTAEPVLPEFRVAVAELFRLPTASV